MLYIVQIVKPSGKFVILGRIKKIYFNRLDCNSKVHLPAGRNWVAVLHELQQFDVFAVFDKHPLTALVWAEKMYSP